MHLYPEPDGAPDHYNADPKTRCDGSMRGTGTVSQFLPRMSKVAGRPIIDKTGLTGRYNYFLCYAAISPQARVEQSECNPFSPAPICQNWSGNLVHRPASDGVNYYFVPSNFADLKSALSQVATIPGATIRVSGQRHSLPPLVADDNRNAVPAKTNVRR